MITTLYIKDESKEKGVKKLLKYIRGNKTFCKIKRYGPVTIREMNYIKRRNRINYDELAKKIGMAKCKTVCSRDYAFPESCGIKRFDPYVYRERLALNMGLFILDSISGSEKLNIGFYDKNAAYSSFLPQLLRRSNSVITFTENTARYEERAYEIIEETGASSVISASPDCLSKCDLIIAPKAIDRELSPKCTAVILTSKKPLVQISCRVYYDYDVSLSQELLSVKPKDTDDSDFAGAVCLLGRINTLSYLIPKYCKNDCSVIDSEALLEYMRKLCGETAANA